MKRFSPLSTIALNQPVGQRDADMQIFPFLAHLREVYDGYGMQDSYDICSMYLQAMLSTAATVGHKELRRIVLDACNAWIGADKRRAESGQERIVLTGDQMKTISKAVKIFLIALPQVKVAIWVGAMLHGKQVLERSIAASKSTC